MPMWKLGRIAGADQAVRFYLNVHMYCRSRCFYSSCVLLGRKLTRAPITLNPPVPATHNVISPLLLVVGFHNRVEKVEQQSSIVSDLNQGRNNVGFCCFQLYLVPSTVTVTLK